MTALLTIDPPATDYLPVSRITRDGDVIKFCQRTGDHYEIESVIIPMGTRDNTWRTLCVSSQIGCARGCTFCQTAQMGLLRNLTVDEIIGQVRAARDHFGAYIRNLVFMGMGEPMDNLDNVIESIRRLHDDQSKITITSPVVQTMSLCSPIEAPMVSRYDSNVALAGKLPPSTNEPTTNQIPRRRITVSTVGRCDGIRKLAALNWRRLGLAVSLNAPNDDIRSQIMPINRTEPMAMLRDAIAAYPVRAGGHVLIEYVLIKGVNDHPDHAHQLAEYLAGLPTCVNLIPYNPREDSPFETSTEAACDEFQTILMQSGQLAFRRSTKGQSAMAACGQLGNLALRRTSQRV
ncbi:MAG: 23S rRNA (adenine(2503)-C(2))-methyltransferase RlmN [Planctomycetota bacterium]